MIEMMMVVVVIAILTVVAVVGYTRIFRKARSTEVVEMFTELKAREDAYHAEHGKYVPVCESAAGATADSDCVEATADDYWPTPLVGKGNQTDATAPSIRWQTLHVHIPTGGLYCQYKVIAGLANDAASMGATGTVLFPTTPVRNWYYLMAQCDWDGDPLVNALYWQRDDLTELGKSNEQN